MRWDWALVLWSCPELSWGAPGEVNQLEQDYSRSLPCELQLGETELQHVLSGDSFDLLWLECGDAVLQDGPPERQEVRGPDYQSVHKVVAGAGELVAAHQPVVLHRGGHPLSPDGDGQRAEVLVNTKPVLVIWKEEYGD